MAQIRNQLPRQYELDWLRVLIILNIVPYHAAWMMTSVKGFSQISQTGLVFRMLEQYVAFIHLWHMPLLFFISGAASYFALGVRPTGEYVRERFLRLLVPLLAFMVFGYAPLAYFWPGVAPEKSLTGYFVNFWPAMLQTLHSNASGTPRWAHLWFVAYLLLSSFVALPLFLYLKKPIGMAWVKRLASLFDCRGVVLLAGLPLAAIWGILSLKWPFVVSARNIYSDWMYFCYHLTAFVYGFVFCLDERFRRSVDRHMVPALILGVVSVAIGWTGVGNLRDVLLPEANLTTDYALIAGLRGMCVWSWIVGVLGLGRRFLTSSHRFLKYFNPASYPCYILHLTLMTIIGHYVTQWNTGTMAEFLIFTALSFMATVAGWEVVKRIRLARFLFGVKG